ERDKLCKTGFELNVTLKKISIAFSKGQSETVSRAQNLAAFLVYQLSDIRSFFIGSIGPHGRQQESQGSQTLLTAHDIGIWERFRFNKYNASKEIGWHIFDVATAAFHKSNEIIK